MGHVEKMDKSILQKVNRKISNYVLLVTIYGGTFSGDNREMFLGISFGTDGNCELDTKSTETGLFPVEQLRL